MINYDPEGKPEISDEALRQARTYGMHVFQVWCDEPKDKRNDDTGVNFLTIGPFLPRVGEILTLQDGTDCVVKRAVHKVGKMGNSPALYPIIYAVRS